MWGNVGEIQYFWKFLQRIENKGVERPAKTGRKATRNHRYGKMIFTGINDAKLDAKGRVFLPSDYRKQMAESDLRFMLRRDVYQPCLVIYPYASWTAEVDSLRARLNRWDSRQAMMYRQFLAGAERMTLDAAGRFLIPKRLLQECGIDRSVRFMGIDDRIEVWAAEKAEQAFMNADEMAQAAQALLGGTPPSAAI